MPTRPTPLCLPPTHWAQCLRVPTVCPPPRSSTTNRADEGWTLSMTKRLDGPSAMVRIRVMKRDRFRCTYCGVPGTDAELEVDHIIAVANGGSHHMSNLTTACRACNQKKGTGTLEPTTSAAQSVRQHVGLVGMWFHTFKDGDVHWQGQVLSVDGDVVLVQLYEWFFGMPGQIKPILKSFMYSDECQLYPTHEHMNCEYERLSLLRENRDGQQSVEMR